MPGFAEAYIFARKKNKGVSTGKRFKEILSILRKHKVKDGLTPDKAVAVLEDLGATFVKLGQIASTHPDMLPKEYCDAFAALRSHVSPMDYPTVVKTVEGELGRPLSEVFSEFEETAVGSASIAQVHRAKTKEKGKVVAVKVQRPGVIEKVSEDLAILERIVDIYDLVAPDEGKVSVKELLDELVRTSHEELDFTIEAKNLTRFYDNNKDREMVGSPRCYTELSTPALLVEDYLSSPRVGDIDQIQGLTDEKREQLAYLMARNYVQQVMEDGFFHADPHAGNILITPDFGIEWIDFGMMGEMTQRERDKLMGLIEALVKGDAYSLQRALLKVMKPVGAVDHGQLIDTCETLIDEFVNVDLASFDTSALINELMDAMTGCGYKIDAFLVTLARGLVTFEGTVKMVSPKLNIMSVIGEYAQSGVSIDDIEKKARHLAASGVQSAQALASLPTKASDTLDMLQKGQVKVGMAIDVEEKFSRDVTGAINNFAFAILACGMIVGSCILCTTGLQPQMLGIPALGFLGFVFGIALMLFVSWRIIASTRAKRR